MSTLATRRLAPNLTGTHRGTIVRIEHGRVFVSPETMPDARIVCERLHQEPSVPQPMRGDFVLFSVPEASPGFGYLLGLIRPSTESRRRRTTPSAAPRRYLTTCGLDHRNSDDLWVTLAGDHKAVRATRYPEWDDRVIQELQSRGARLLAEVDTTRRPRSVTIIGLPALPSGSDRRIEAGRIVLDGKEEVVLRTKRAMIVLRANGDIEMLGTRIVSRARAEQKLLAPMLKLN